MLEGGGPVLGILSDRPVCGDAPRSWSRATSCCIYSDGVTEANNPNYDEFGEDRFIEVLRRHRRERSEVIVEAVTRSLTEFAAGAPQADDITLVVAKRLG